MPFVQESALSAAEQEKQEVKSQLTEARTMLEETKSRLNSSSQDLEAERRARAAETSDLAQRLEKVTGEKQAIELDLSSKVWIFLIRF